MLCSRTEFQSCCHTNNGSTTVLRYGSKKRLGFVLNYRPLLAALFVVIGLFLVGRTQGQSAAANRILIIGYGQSNMGTMFTNCTPPCTAPDLPAALPNTYIYDGASLIAVPVSNGLRAMQNSVTAATGLPTVSINCAVGGSNIDGFTSTGGGAFGNCVAKVNAIITPQDKVFILWDQGEGDASAQEYPGYYAPTLVKIHKDFAAAIGRTTANCPFLTSQKGTASFLPGSINGGTTQQSWQTIKNAQIWAPLYEAGGGMVFSHTDMDFVRTDGYHYDGLLGSKLAGQRYAQAINTIMGVASPSGYATWSISGSSTVDATHTMLAVTHSLGTDFTPSTGGTGFEVSGDNGARWINAVASRADATHISLLHSSISTTKARIVRYQYGFSPPDTDINCNGSGGLCRPSSAMIFDNSSLAVPLSPTSWEVRPAPLTTIPVPTWRDAEATISVNGPSDHTKQTVSGLLLGPDGDRKMIVLVMAGEDFAYAPLVSMTITPQDYLGNNVGSPISPTSLRPVVINGAVAIFTAVLGPGNAAATTFKLDYQVTIEPFSGAVVQVFTVPFADLNSTTRTATGTASPRSTQTGTVTLNTSAGGFIICSANDGAGPATGSFNGSFNGTQMTVTDNSTNPFIVGQAISGQTGLGSQLVKPNTVIVSQASGTRGSLGTYNLNTTNTIAFNATNHFDNRTNLATASSSTGEKFAVRWETNGIHNAVFDASNSPGATPASATIIFIDPGNLTLACASWR